MHAQPWPVADPDLVKVDTVTMVVQVNGKVRDRIEVDAGIGEAEADGPGLAAPKVVEALAGRPAGQGDRPAPPAGQHGRLSRRRLLVPRTGRPVSPAGAWSSEIVPGSGQTIVERTVWPARACRG